MKSNASKLATCLLSSSLLMACGEDSSDTATSSSTSLTDSNTETGMTDSMTESGVESGSSASESAGDGDSSGSAGDGDSSTSAGDGDSGTSAGDGDSSTSGGDGDGGTTSGGDGDSGTTSGGDGDGGTTSGGDGDSGTSGDGDNPNWWDGEVEVPCPPDGGEDATLTGTVHAPNGTVPVSGALVYVTDDMPTPPQDGVYCEQCVEFVCDSTEGTLSNPDGSFTLNAHSGTGRYLVIQKGQFMRVTQLDVAAGTTAMSQSETDLPGSWNPGGGEWIPRIAVGYGSYDRIEDALGKLGLGDTMIASMEETLVGGTASFDIYDNGQNPATDGHTSQGSFASLLDNPSLMDQYHIIFIPCSTDATSLNATRIQNIRDWVEKGGRWYASDWSAEMIGEVFPEYQTFYGGSNPDLSPSYDSDATTPDAGLLEWLTALPDALKDINPLNDETHPTLTNVGVDGIISTQDNWSGVQGPLPVILVDDGEGGQVNTGHRIWLEGPGGVAGIPASPDHPLAITAQFGCGKLQFTSFQAAEFFDYVGLSPQELVLMYTILEIGVCQEDIPLPE